VRPGRPSASSPELRAAAGASQANDRPQRDSCATAEGEFYTPNVYIGVALSAVLIGRLIYRFVVLAPEMQSASQGAFGNPYGSFQRSPLTRRYCAVLHARQDRLPRKVR